MGDMPIIRTGHCGPHGTFFGAACPLCAMAISGVDPRDARIAELEAALAGLVDALPRCDTCTKRGTTDWSGYGQAAIYCDEHLGFKSGSTLEWDSEAEAAERALGRRK